MATSLKVQEDQFDRAEARVASMSTGNSSPTVAAKSRLQKRPNDSRRVTKPKQKKRKSTKRREETPVDEDKFFAIKGILDERTRDGNRQYKIGWADINPKTGRAYRPSWQPEENVTDEAIVEWKKKIGLEASSSSQPEPPSSQDGERAQLPETGTGRKRRFDQSISDEEGSAAKRARSDGSTKYNQTRYPELDSEDLPEQSSGERTEQLPNSLPLAEGRVNGIAVELPEHPSFDPSEYLRISSSQTSSQNTQSTVLSSPQRLTPPSEGAAPVSRFGRDVVIPDSQAISESTIGGPRPNPSQALTSTAHTENSQAAHNHFQTDAHNLSTSEIPSHQPGNILLSASQQDRLNSGFETALGSTAQSQAAYQSHSNSFQSAASKSSPAPTSPTEPTEPIFLTQLPFEGNSASATSSWAQPSQAQVETTSEPSNQASSSAGVTGSSQSFSQAAQVVHPLISQVNQEIVGESQTEEGFSVYNDEPEIAPGTVSQDASQPSQALSELDGNIRISSSSGPVSHALGDSQSQPNPNTVNKSSGQVASEQSAVDTSSFPAPLQGADASSGKEPEPRSPTRADMEESPSSPQALSTAERLQRMTQRAFSHIDILAPPSFTFDDVLGPPETQNVEAALANSGAAPAIAPSVDFSDAAISPSLLLPVPSAEAQLGENVELGENAEGSHAFGAANDEVQQPEVPQAPGTEFHSPAPMPSSYVPVPEEPATLNPSALSLSIEHDPVESSSGHTGDGVAPEPQTQDFLAPEDIMEDVAEDAPDDVPQDSMQEVPRDAMEDAPEDVIEDVPQDVMGGAPEDALAEAPEEAPEVLQETTEEGESQEYPGKVLPYIGSGPNEYLVTLALANGSRPVYAEIMRKHTDELKAFNSAFTVTPYRSVEPVLVQKVDEVLNRLFDVCDLPPFLETLSSMRPDTITKHVKGSNSKFAFVAELLEQMNTSQTQKKVLILARPSQIIDLLNNVVQTGGYHQFRSNSGSIPDSSSEPAPLTVLVASTSDDLSSLPSDFDVVIAFDHTFRQNLLPPRGGNNPPTILALVTTSTIQHINMRISGKVNALERKNMLLVALWHTMDAVEEPTPGFLAPHAIAEMFAKHIESPDDDGFYWTPDELPEKTFEYFYASSEAEPTTQLTLDPNGMSSRSVGRSVRSGRSVSRKRSLDGDADISIPKRPRIHQPEISMSRIHLSNPLNRLLGKDVVLNSDKGTVEVSVEKLEAMAAKHAKLEAELKQERQVKEDLRKLCDRTQLEVQSWNRTVERTRLKLDEAGKQCRIFEDERNKAQEKQRSLAKSLEASQKEVASLGAARTELQQKLEEANDALSNGGNPDMVKFAELQREVAEYASKVDKLEKDLVQARRDGDFARDRYQAASHAASELGTEKQERERHIEELARKADDTIVEVNRIHAQHEVRELDCLLKEERLIVKERDAEISRLSQELKSLKSNRRDTRQNSVPRSPRLAHLGTMSPRNAGRAPASSRGTSPSAPLGEGPGASFSGNGRFEKEQQSMRHEQVEVY